MNIHGKIMRLDRNGNARPDNPFANDTNYTATFDLILSTATAAR